MKRKTKRSNLTSFCETLGLDLIYSSSRDLIRRKAESNVCVISTATKFAFTYACT